MIATARETYFDAWWTAAFPALALALLILCARLAAALEEGDTIVTSYRDHGHMLAAGMDPKGVMAELTGRRGGYSRPANRDL